MYNNNHRSARESQKRAPPPSAEEERNSKLETNALEEEGVFVCLFPVKEAKAKLHS